MPGSVVEAAHCARVGWCETACQAVAGSAAVPGGKSLGRRNGTGRMATFLLAQRLAAWKAALHA
ncbi:MAG TPA: hypothetical protein VKT82_27180 [Ktedonobacterales bacterium]|nr:hypothetical protein [Ktedonobacterales bacterium]